MMFSYFVFQQLTECMAHSRYSKQELVNKKTHTFLLGFKNMNNFLLIFILFNV